MATHAQRIHMRSIMDMLLAYEPLVHYEQHRPMRTTGVREQQLVNAFRHRASVRIDCSEAVCLVCRLAGLADPTGNNYNYNGYGNTQSMLNNPALPHYTNYAAAQMGALVIFGPHGDATKQHVCLVYEPSSSDPLLWSHGQERGPLTISLSDERKYHAPPVTFLSIANL